MAPGHALGPFRSLGSLEGAVMEIAWSADRPLSVRDVIGRLDPDRRLAYTTVLTVMDKLRRKGWLLRTTGEGRAHLYAPAETRDVLAARLMREALGSGADHHATLAFFVAGIGAEEAQALRGLLDENDPGS
ncbi:MAG TPA: BlaI/MecI/CopY family transcriptional regulator [Gemmatimonadaceae bacterium]|nr:BlaI/MecI/CopY family transcriptional regulator [Gemmatimonadaceae bacterium]